MNFLLVLLLFIFWRIFDFVIIFISQKVIPYLGFFPYRDQLPGFGLPSWVSALANFDGLHYISIARNGYAQYEQAFFPLYPMLINFLTPLFSNNQLLTGLIISNVSFLIGITILARSYKDSKWIIIFLLFFPTSFFFGAVYTEGLFFLLLISTFYFLKKERYLLVVVFAFLASLTRLVGVFLIIPILFHLIQKFLRLRSGQAILNTKYLILLVSPLLGLGLYCFYLWQTTSDPFFFLTSQPIFGANRSSHLILLPQVYYRYLKIFVTAAHDSRFYVSVVEFFMFNFVFIILILDLFKNYKFKIKNYDLIALNIFSLVNLILPTLTGTFSSIPRYSLFSISFFIYLSQIKNISIKYLILIIFIILHVLLLGYFTQGYFIS
jgi:Gpi18-like mannosyltransferase